MRLTGGEARGRLLSSPPSGLRPTQDRVRAAVYSALAPHVPGARVLDLFAGTGACGLEAWSRGASAVTWVESAPAAFRALAANLRALRVPDGPAFRAVRADVFRYLSRPAPEPPPFTWALADPPYELARAQNWLPRLAALLLENRWLAPPALFLFETDVPPDPIPPPLPPPILHRAYGSTHILLFQLL